MEFEHIKCPLKRYTFSVKPMREWAELNCEGRVLNLFAGKTLLNVDELRNDVDPDMPADFHMDALELVEHMSSFEVIKDSFSVSMFEFETILLDPPYSYRKSMEMYNGFKASPFRQLKDALPNILAPNGKIITFGYHSISMGKGRGFEVEKVALFSHGGAIHDTIATIERKVKA